MKCLVPVKRVPDPYVTPRVKPDGSGVIKENIKMAMNPFDEIAIEEAVRKKELGIISEIITISIGDVSSQETLRQALARGADKAILVTTDLNLEPLTIAKVLKKFVKENNIDIVIMGKQAIDDDNNQTGQMLAGLLGFAQATFISSLEINKEENSALAIREVDGGLETIKVNLPAVFTTDLRLNEPRYISLPNVMQAKRKPLDTLNFADLGIENNKDLEILKVEPPPARKAGIKVESVSELIDKLKTEAHVI